MSLIPDSVTKTYKNILDKASYIYEANKIILHNTGFQHKCLFECIIYPEKPQLSGLSMQSVKNIANIGKDLQIVRTFLYSINDIQLVNFDFERAGGFNFIKEINYAETITMTFLETQLGVVKNYLRTWMEQIAYYEPTLREYYLNDNQIQSEKTCLIIPQQKDYLPSLIWIKIDGMKIKNISGIDYSHEDGDIEKISVDFKVDNIRLITAL